MTNIGELPNNYYANTAPVVSDWASVIRFTPGSYFAPESLAEVQAILTMLAAGGLDARTLRILGGLHSCSEIFESDVVIDTTRLPLAFDTAPLPGGGAAVTASGYMHLHDFLARAAEQNLSLTAAGGTDAQTLAGLISTNTAAATVHHSVYEGLQWVEFLTVAADGKTIETVMVTVTDPAFLGVIASLGAIGFVSRMCFNLVPERFYTGEFEIVEVSDVLGDIPATCAKYDFWRIEWIPNGNQKGLLWHAVPDSGPVDKNGDYPVDGTENLLKLLMRINSDLLGDTPFCNEPLMLAYDVMIATYSPTTASGPMRNIIPCDRLAPLHVAMAEWSFDPADIAQVMHVCSTYWNANKWPNLPTEIECTRTDAYWMSPWNWPELPYIVKLNFQYLTDYLDQDGKQLTITHLKGLWEALDAAGIAFKAHWGKINFLDADSVAKRYQLGNFLPTIKPLFLNAYLKQRLVVAA